MLAEAMCKLEGFRYEPSETVYWQQGRSTERDYLYVTTQTLTHEQLELLNEEVGPERTLLICCGAYRGNPDNYPNLTLKKIPNLILNRCEWGHDDYSLKVANLPQAAPDKAPATASAREKAAVAAGQLSMLDGPSANGENVPEDPSSEKWEAHL